MSGVLIMAGGTGGHIFPGLAVAEQLATKDIPVTWLGASGGMESKLVPAHGIAFHEITIRGLRGNGLRGWLQAPWTVGRAIFTALKLMRRLRPRCVLSMGGYVAGPGGIAAWLMRRPLVVHEQNSVAGLTNRALALVATRVLTGFDGVFSASRHAVRVGNPVRADLSSTSEPAQRFGARKGPMRLLVLGGSQGAMHLNTTVPQALAGLAKAGEWAVRHQCGERHLKHCQEAYQAAGFGGSDDVSIEPFIKDMAAAYEWADLVIARAGALTVAELSAVGCASVLVPFPYAVDDHQTTNAAQLRDVGAARVVAESELTVNRLNELLTELKDRNALAAMASAAKTLGHANAAKQVADVCMEVARR
ncbi:MAG: UDP-N-acetylglucosamine--N-acetylmuramyl-(pentapeptide) pyrophosphoryl-undecaprenol N-acetylglucosamine transferase [Lysobacteraceae bacterium]|nr:MAG: UDP-N-acetylglucosamine--N-acetylmuramyl-(pentapeptide) pyrophosphoryl-undecaprenol N-acetylglucosamine transferase [Xanthomonadaceae bacterium]